MESDIADNYSTDRSREILRVIAAKDPQFKVILNANNFGHIRSPYNAMLQATGDAVVLLCSDLQEPPEMIVDFVRQWEAGYQVVCGVKPKSRENPLMFQVRRFYYWLLASCSQTSQIRNFTGFGLYDRKAIEAVKKFNEPYPYFRGLISEIGLFFFFSSVQLVFIGVIGEYIGAIWTQVKNKPLVIEDERIKLNF
jgi:glycosyltransferase involved in cell wall biosynthesis